MAKNRYGRIHHSNHSYINLRFPSTDARDAFAVKFQKYHDGHDHDGEAPRFEEIKAAEAGSTTYESGKLHDAHSVTIDGYATYEIEEYHEDEKHTHYYRYKPPTCCVPPLISIDRKLVDSGTLERHELSAIFGDMDDEDYQPLLESVEKDGFIDNVIRLYEGQILDGWHRYRAAKELNLIRKLRFTQWHEDEHRDGDPKAFVFGRNIHRRHYTPGRRAQITVEFNERFGMGRPQSEENEESPSNDGLKSREELAKEAGVGVATIDRAVAVKKEGESEAVIAGEKTAGEVIKVRDAEKLKKRKKQVLKNIWDTRIQAAREYTGEGDTALNLHLTLPELEKGFAENNESYADAFESGMKRIDAAVTFNTFQERALDVDEFGNAKVDMEDLEAENRAISTYAGDICQWKREDWSPDTNWILPLIAAKKKGAEQKQEDQFKAAVNNAKTRLSWMWDSFDSSDIAKHLSRKEFALVAAQQFGWYIENDYGSGENYMLEEDFALLQNLGSVNEVNKWRKRFDTVQDALHKNEAWIQALIPDTETSETELYYDLNQMRVLGSTLSPLLERLGADDMSHSSKDELTSSLYDVFLQYEEVPTEKEMIVALFGVMDMILSEEFPID